MNNSKWHRAVSVLGLFSILAWLSACGASFQVAGDVAQGQTALFAGNYPSAQSYFQNAAQADPNFITSTGQLPEGISSYLGRAQYLNGQLEAARDTLQKAVAQQGSNNNVTLARLYLGLTMARLGDRQGGVKDIESGTKGIIDFVNYIQQNFRYSYGPVWDRGDLIRNAANANLKMIAGGNIDWPTLLSNSEWLAMKFEREAYENQ
jgi:tetratricopeptide (TPR) repeat protein